MRRMIVAALACIALSAQASNPQLGFNELAANQAQPHITINAADRSITQAVAGYLQINFATNANLTLTSSQWAYATIALTDTGPVLTTGRDVIYPNVDSLTGGVSRMRFVVKNATAQTLTVKRSGQTGVAIAAGSMALVQHNGTDIEEVASGGGGTVDLTTDVTGILPGANGGTANGFTAFSGPASTLKTFTLPNATSTILTSNALVTFGQGGTGLGSASDDQLMVSSGSAWVAKTMPDCIDTGGNHINYTQSTNVFSCGTSGGGGGTPGGSDTQVQYNSSGSFAGDADWAWNATTNLMQLGSVATPATIRGFTQTGTTGNGGDLLITAGAGGSSTGTGGNLILKGGACGGGGCQGNNVEIWIGDGGVDGAFAVRNAAGGVTPLMYVSSAGAINFNGSFGSAGNVLVSNNFSGANWGTVNLASSFAVTGVLPYANMAKDPVRVVTAAGTITVATTDKHVCVNKTSGAATAVNLQSSPVTGFPLSIDDCKGDAATNNITVTPAAGTIDGSATLVINTNYGSATMYYTGTMWKVTAVR